MQVPKYDLKPSPSSSTNRYAAHLLGLKAVRVRRHLAVVAHSQAEPVAPRVVEPDGLAEDPDRLLGELLLRRLVHVERAWSSLLGP